MNGENTIAKIVQVISVIALMIGASGCATQATGGSKLDHNELRSVIRHNQNTIEVCNQYGAKMSCQRMDRDQVREDFEYLRDSLRYGDDR